MKFNDESKAVKEFADSNYFGYGVHHVHIGAVDRGFTGDDPENGKEYFEITVLGDNEEEDTARVWFSSDKAANYSFNVLRQIAVHNAPEDQKDAMRDTVDAVADTEELLKVLNEKVVGGDCWFTKYQSPDRTYKAADGTVRKSVDKNVYGYEPKLRTDLISNDELTKENIDTVFPVGDDAGSVAIPKNTDWA